MTASRRSRRYRRFADDLRRELKESGVGNLQHGPVTVVISISCQKGVGQMLLEHRYACACKGPMTVMLPCNRTHRCEILTSSRSLLARQHHFFQRAPLGLIGRMIGIARGA